jgi:hypothetical protein
MVKARIEQRLERLEKASEAKRGEFIDLTDVILHVWGAWMPTKIRATDELVRDLKLIYGNEQDFMKG